MSGTTFRDLIRHLWEIAYTDVPREERRRRYQVLLEQLDAHASLVPDERDYPLHNVRDAKIRGWIDALHRAEQP